MVVDVSTSIAIVALMWTIYQQYSINKMCSECKFRNPYLEKKNKIKA